MEIKDIKKHSISTILEIKQKKDAKFEKNEQINIFEKDGKFFLGSIVNKKITEIEGINNKNLELLNRITRKNLPRLSYIVKIDDSELVLKINEFEEERPADFDILCEDEFVDAIKKKLKNNNIDFEKELNKNFLISNDEKKIIIGININKESKNDIFENFLIYGENGYLSVKKINKEENNIYFIANKIVSNIKEEEYKFILLSGKINFKNSTFAERVKLETLATMTEIGDSIESYLNIWNKYGEIEAEESINRLKITNCLKYQNVEYLPEGKIRIDIEDVEKLRLFAENVEENEILFICKEYPEIFQNEINFEMYEKYISEQKKEGNIIQVELSEKIKFEDMRLFVLDNDDSTIPENGYIFISILGESSVYRRRKEARDSILTTRNPMPQLALLLEGKTISKPRKTKIEAISQKLKEEIFPIHDPTPKQKEAIEIALNTPDIALIQGPPGTGKTTVILGILKRLNEISKSEDGLFAKNLISAYQHDAVDNAVQRLEILGLPAVKFGKKSSEKDKIEIIEKNIESWINEKIVKLEEKNIDLKKDEYFLEFEKIRQNYLYSSNTIQESLNLLEKLKSLLTGKISLNLFNEINEIIKELKAKTSFDSNKRLTKFLYKIPVSKVAFEDGGKEILNELIIRLRREDGVEEYYNYFENILIKRQINFKEIKQKKKELLLKYLPKENIFSTPKQQNSIVDLISKIADELNEKLLSTKMGEDYILLKYIQEYNNTPLEVREAILNYTSVVGATNQQVMGKMLMDLKGENKIYDNVLIDEAARSNPLDLFIPMSIAKDRIILVGDHRQLPHIVDDNITKEIEEKYKDENKSINDKIEENIKKSMFEYLFKTIKKLEESDGIKRTITLDKQYRTHPILGDFVSKNFYEKHGETSIGSGLKEENFKHNIPGLENRACVFYDINSKEGKEKSGTSKSRQIEAKKIAEHLKSIIDLNETKELNFGIITFYREQVNIIMEELEKVGITLKNEEGTYDYRPEYKNVTIKNKVIEKLRVGTVDAFQGMEFDVVYLSMVRSNDFLANTEREKQKKYGFLMVENRLCVSMSRQKKMLIVVGDSDMLTCSGAKNSVGALVDYYNLCKGDEKYGKILF